MSDPHSHDDDRLTRLLRPDHRERARLKVTGHRRAFVLRWVRLLLPLAALGIVAVVVAWPQMDTAAIAPVPKENVLPQTVGRNELINPRFESEDSDSQPYTVTAESATQDDTDQNLVILQKPKADLKMANGAWVAGEADSGQYKQDLKILDLTGNVRLYQDQGYTLETASLHLDMNTRRATTDAPVNGHGPDGTIVATGLDADATLGTIIFTGPATLTLHSTIKGLSQ